MADKLLSTCARSLYYILCYSKLVSLTIPKALFTELLTAAFRSVEFSFNNIMYEEIEGAVFHSLFGPALTYLLDITKRNCFDKQANPFCLFVSFMTPLSSLTRNQL